MLTSMVQPLEIELLKIFHPHPDLYIPVDWMFRSSGDLPRQLRTYQSNCIFISTHTLCLIANDSYDTPGARHRGPLSDELGLDWIHPNRDE